MSETRLTRRALIVALSASGAGLLVASVGGCQPAAPAAPTASLPTAIPTAPPSPAAERPAATPNSAASPTATAEPTKPAVATLTSQPATPAAPTAAAAPAQASGHADLVVVRGPSPANITRAAVEAIGGIGRYVPKGATVVVKPNVCTAMAPEYAATTNPEVVATLVSLCKEAGAAKVKVLDYPWGPASNVAYAASGIEEAVKQAGGEMVQITPLKWKKTDLPKGKTLKTQEIFEDVLTANVVINVPIAKDHGLARLTLGMKNLMGVVRSREPYHGALGQSLSDLFTVVKPAFTLVDCVRILTANGPGGGRLSDVKKLDTVIASTDVVAADAYAATLFGMKPDALETVRTGQANGLGTYDLSKLKVAEVKRG